VLFFCVEESERIHHDGSGGAFGSKWQPPHVATNPTNLSAKFGREMSRASQESDREVEANDLSSTFRQGERMAPMTATDVDDPRAW
jgi:hypothetical protein